MEELRQQEKGGDKNNNPIPPFNWYFQSYFAFMMWGPFADPSDRLIFMVTGNCHKSKKQSRALMRKQ